MQQNLNLLAAVLLTFFDQNSVHPLPHQCLGQFWGFLMVRALRHNLVISQLQYPDVVHGAVAIALLRVLVAVDAPEKRALALLVHLDLQCHGFLAVGAVHLILQPVVERMPVHMSAAAEDLLHPRKHICVNDGFVGVLHDDLLLLGDAASFFGLVAHHLALVVDHVPDVHRVMEYLGQRAGVPGDLFVGVLVQVCRKPGVALLRLVDGRVDDFPVFEFFRNSRYGHSYRYAGTR